jgi:hypothetical protein
MAIMARDGDLPPIGFQLLLYPATDMAGERPAYQRFTENLILTDKTMRWFINHYVPDPARRVEWQASPLRASSLKGVAAAFGRGPPPGVGLLCLALEPYAERLLLGGAADGSLTLYDTARRPL